jgi:hypothetical protein
MKSRAIVLRVHAGLSQDCYSLHIPELPESHAEAMITEAFEDASRAFRNALDAALLRHRAELET